MCAWWTSGSGRSVSERSFCTLQLVFVHWLWGNYQIGEEKAQWVNYPSINQKHDSLVSKRHTASNHCFTIMKASHLAGHGAQLTTAVYNVHYSWLKLPLQEPSSRLKIYIPLQWVQVHNLITEKLAASSYSSFEEVSYPHPGEITMKNQWN